MSQLRLKVKSKNRLLAQITTELGDRGYEWTPADEHGSPACLSFLVDELAAKVQARAFVKVRDEQANILAVNMSSHEKIDAEKIDAEKILAGFLSAGPIASQLADVYGVDNVEEIIYSIWWVFEI